MSAADYDTTGLIREAYRIDGITEPECRSIFLDWALRLPVEADQIAAIQAMLDIYGAEADHPMTGVLKEGLAPAERPKRRGGRRR